jgi:hypothetical protein
MNTENILSAIIAILLFVIGFMYIYDGENITLERAKYESDLTNISTSTYLRFIYIGSSDCGFCNNNTHRKVRKIKKSLRELSDGKKYNFVSSGIALDTYGFSGLNYINKTKPYDEIIAGAGWFNLGAKHYIWDKSPGKGKPATPQILITFNEFNVIYGANSGLIDVERDEKILKRYIGVKELDRLYQLINKENNEVINRKFGLNKLVNQN